MLTAEGIASRVLAEVERIQHEQHGFNSQHEAYAVLLEEVDEYWQQVKRNPANRVPGRMRDELIQIAAVAIAAAIREDG